MTVDQVRAARQQACDSLRKAGCDANLQIKSKQEFVQVVKDVHRSYPQGPPGTLGLHVYDGTGGVFVGLLERIEDDKLRREIIDEILVDDRDPKRWSGDNHYPAKLSAGTVPLVILRSGCTTADNSEFGRIASGGTKFSDPKSYPPFMLTPAGRGLFVGSRFATPG